MTRADASFALDPRLAAGSLPLADWPLCHLRLKDDPRFPWLLLVPRRSGAVELTDLDDAAHAQLVVELRAALRRLAALARPDKTNVATLGNLVPQLHIHVVGRFRGDAGWPRAIWCLPAGEPYPAAQLGWVRDRYASLFRTPPL